VTPSVLTATLARGVGTEAALRQLPKVSALLFFLFLLDFSYRVFTLATDERRGRLSRDARQERTQSPFRSTGRGGAGNIARSLSPAADRESAVFAPIESEVARGRQLEHEIHVGRGVSTLCIVSFGFAYTSTMQGKGNVRSPSRDPGSREREKAALEADEKLRLQYEAEQQSHPSYKASGRGSWCPFFHAAHTLTRNCHIGGAGNIKVNKDASTTADVSAESHHLHSSGRGGAGNISNAEAPPEDLPRGRDSGAGRSGRGGVGNTSRSRSRAPASRADLPEEEEEEAIRREYEAKAAHVHHSGRGGLGYVLLFSSSAVGTSC
jgi:hypothetical protein